MKFLFAKTGAPKGSRTPVSGVREAYLSPDNCQCYLFSTPNPPVLPVKDAEDNRSPFSIQRSAERELSVWIGITREIWGVPSHKVGVRGVDRMTYLKPVPPVSPGNHLSNGNQAGHALTLKPDRSMGADQSESRSRPYFPNRDRITRGLP